MHYYIIYRVSARELLSLRTLEGLRMMRAISASVSWKGCQMSTSPRMLTTFFTKRQAITVFVRMRDKHVRTYVRKFFLQKYSLRANFTTRTCERRYLNETFRPFSIPYNARYVDTLEIGSNIEEGLGLEVYVWEGETDGTY